MLLYCVVGTLLFAVAGCATEADTSATGAGREDAADREQPGADNGSDRKGKPHSKEEHRGGHGGEGGGAPAATVLRVHIRGARVVAPEKPTVSVGEAVRMVVSSDTSDEVHVHGYDVMTPVGPGKKAEIAFRADIPGVFEVELEEAGRLLFELTVQ